MMKTAALLLLAASGTLASNLRTEEEVKFFTTIKARGKCFCKFKSACASSLYFIFVVPLLRFFQILQSIYYISMSIPNLFASLHTLLLLPYSQKNLRKAQHRKRLETGQYLCNVHWHPSPNGGAIDH